MRTYFKEPIYELIPLDDVNAVPVIYKIQEGCEFQLASPYPVVLDPTRRIENAKSFWFFDRKEIEMHHMTLVRKNMRMKLQNVSNRGNYAGVEQFLQKFEKWKPEDGVIHPHPHIGKNKTITISHPFKKENYSMASRWWTMSSM